jgi:ketosteroid isomerase-like protein
MSRHRSPLKLSATSRLLSPLLAFLVACFTGCQHEPPDPRAQDERAIRDADAATLKAAQSNDVDTVVANYADDASWLPPNAPIADGKPAIRAGWAKLISSTGFTIDWQINKILVARSGDLAYTVSIYQLSLEGPNRRPINDQGKDLAVWKKQPSGTWKIAVNTYNSDLPSISPKPPATKHSPTKRHTKRKKSR